MRKAIARVKRHARQSDRWQPHHLRILHADARRPYGNAWSKVVAPIADERPPVVLPCAEDVELVAPTRTLLCLPDLTGFRVHAETVAVAMTQRVDGGFISA